MPSFLYHASDFPAHYPHLVGTHELAISWAELNWAAQTVGKAEEDVGLHGIYSLFEAAYRTTIVWANLMESGTGRLVKTPSYNALDPSEKGAVSYYLGLTFAKLFAYRRLHVPWLLHFDIYGDEHDAYLEGEAKPDLIGLNEAGDWIVYEAKGRTGGLLNSIMDDAKEQAGEVTTIGGVYPTLRVASLVFFRSDGLHLQVADPPADKRGRKRTLNLSPAEMLARYYQRITPREPEIANDRIETRRGLRYRVLPLRDLDFEIAVPQFEEFTMQAQETISDDRRFVGPDGVEITLGEAWSDQNMRRAPQQRT